MIRCEVFLPFYVYTICDIQLRMQLLQPQYRPANIEHLLKIIHRFTEFKNLLE